METMNHAELAELTADLVGAYVGNNPVPMTDLPKLIREVHAALERLDIAPLAAPEPKPAAKPAVSPKKSIFPDYLISLEDGKRYKALKRHLNTLGMTPQEYREKWKLPADYPMTSASYSAKRSALAKSLGLGQKGTAKRK